MDEINRTSLLDPPSPPAATQDNRALTAAQAGDSTAFEMLTEPYRRELLTHCYRILGSIEDAEDLVQETFLRAWRKINTYEGRAPFRAWLYKVATNVCLDYLDKRPKRTLPELVYAASDAQTPLPESINEPIWLEPYPDELAPRDSSPEARLEKQERITLAFMVALQVLPPRQRCALTLSDVLDWSAIEIASTFGTSLSAVNSLVHRARQTLGKNTASHSLENKKPKPGEDQIKLLLEAYVRAWEAADIDRIVNMLTQDAIFSMPPSPLWLHGRSSIREFILKNILAGEAAGRWRLLQSRANTQPALAWYKQGEKQNHYQAFSIQVLELDGELISQITGFMDPGLFRFFELPSELTV